MSAIPMVHTLEELAPYVKDGVMEIVMRGKNKRFKTFHKVMIENLSQGQEKELAQKVMEALNQNNLLQNKSLNLLQNVAGMQKLGLLLNGLNLCATCAGFAIMYAKLDKMSAEIKQQIGQLQKTMKDSQDIQGDFEFNKVLASHTDMLDCERKQQPYSEEKMRQLVDDEYSVLMLLVSAFQKDVSGDHENLIFSIFSLLSMLTVSLRKFDELYYFNNHLVVGDENPWHLAHDRWMTAYSTLLQEWFVEKLQDYGYLETEMTTTQVDAYYEALIEQLADLQEEVADNQTLIIAFGDMESLRQYQWLSVQEVTDAVTSAFREAGEGFDESLVTTALHNTLQQAALA